MISNGDTVWALVQRYHDPDHNIADHVCGLFATKEEVLAMVAEKRRVFEHDFRFGYGAQWRAGSPIPSWDDPNEPGYMAKAYIVGDGEEG